MSPPNLRLDSGEATVVPVVIGGYEDLPDDADLTATVEIIPNVGENVQIVRSGAHCRWR